MGISSVGNYQVPQIQQSQSLRTNSNKGKLIGGMAGLATGLAVSAPKINNYVTMVSNLKKLDFAHKKSVIAALRDINADSFSSVKNFLKDMRNNAIKSTAITTVATTVVGLGVGFLVDKTIDFVHNKKAKKEQKV